MTDGHLHKRLPHLALDSFSTCASAAENLALCLESYERVHTFSRVPYFLFYAAYVSATIHVRIAAQKNLDSNALAHLLTSLRVFDANIGERSSVQKAKSRIQALMRQSGIGSSTTSHTVLEAATMDGNCLPPTPNVDPQLAPELWDMEDFDVDALLRSFSPTCLDRQSSFYPPGTASDASYAEVPDLSFDLRNHELYGFDALGS